ncbi:M16 family metallopeptidase [Alkanindiges sp. WGS2144]|uniref:M16 family metallopeptidase n=1 Tax=Alkanindiges sp. WGS2144 TaxID=3366808 RepID=UPI0037523A48
MHNNIVTHPATSSDSLRWPASLLSLTLIGTGLCLPATTFAAKPKPANPSPALIQNQSKTHEETLPNGLKVIIREDHRAPVAMTQIWYKVGSTDETGDELGLSHALEHMMFKGTSKVPGEELSRITSKFGGSTNAFTSSNYTGYYELFPAQYVPLALELEADRMQNLQLRQQDFEPEMRVIMEERRQRTDDNPKALAYERFRWMTYPTSSLRQPTIGHMKNLQGLKLDSLKQWYQKWYTPNNAVLIIVGDVDPQKTMYEVRRYFGDIPQRATPARSDVSEFLNIGERQMDLSLPVKIPALYMAWNVESLKTADDPNKAYALALLQSVLDGGLSARFETRLVREQRLLASVSCNYDLFNRGSSLFTITAIPEQGVSLEQARAAILAEIEKLKTEAIVADELERVKTSYLAELIYSQDSIAGQAQLIGLLESADLSYKLIDNIPQQLNQLSVPYLQQIARQYLVKDNLSTLYLRVPNTVDNPAGTVQTTNTSTGSQPNE